MAEYIEREAALEIINSLNIASALCAGRKIINLPPADVSPVRHGEWIVCGDGDNVPWMCSHCGKTTASKYKIMYGKYCPNCGAKMDLEE